MTDVNLLTLWREAARGKSIGRILTNETLKHWAGEINGIVLDLACGREPSYWRVLGLKNNERVCLVGVDYNPGCHPTVVADLTRPMPFKDAISDCVIVSSFIYIVPDPNKLLMEVRRVLKSGGWLFLTAPLVYHHNPEPTDYWRFTEEALELLLRRTGFVEAETVPIGGRFSAAASLLSMFLRPRWLVAPIVYWLCLRLDAWIKRFRLPSCPIGYVVRARKP